MDDKNKKIIEFLDSKSINDQFIRNIVEGYILEHTRLYGDLIPFEQLMDRLYKNLNTIVLEDPNKSPTNCAVGLYEGFEKNKITMYFTQKHLRNIQLREDFIGILLHELTHCAYTIKEGEIYKIERQIFASFDQIEGNTLLAYGHKTYMEPIVNYVACRIFGKSNSAYVSQTSNIAKLASMLGEKRLIHSAFNSDEEEFKDCFSDLPVGAYEYYTKGMECLNLGGIVFNHGKEIMNNFFDGNIVTPSKNKYI